MSKAKHFIFPALLFLCSCYGRRQMMPPPPLVYDPVVTIPQPVVTVGQEQKAQEDSTVVAQMEATARHNRNTVHQGEEGSWLWIKQRQLDSLCNTELFETTQLGILVYDITSDSPVYAMNASHRMRPASCMKLVTAISALHYLKHNYSFATRLCTTGAVRDGVLQGDVYIVGGMDPFFGAVEMQQLTAALKQQGIRHIQGKVLLDETMKDTLKYGEGWCWDDDYGPLSALLYEEKGMFASPLMEALRQAGISVTDPVVESGVCPKDAKAVLVLSHTLDEVLQPMMKKSDNIFAESVFYNLAAHSGKKEAGRQEAAKLTGALISKLGLVSDRYRIADGSGLSLYNYVSPELLVKLLNYAYENETIRRHLLPSLPISGVDGTLAKRMKGTPAENNVKAKTGSVSGVSSLSGYLTAGNGHIFSFSIINQGVEKTSIGADFQNQVCTLLAE